MESITEEVIESKTKRKEGKMKEFREYAVNSKVAL